MQSIASAILDRYLTELKGIPQLLALLSEIDTRVSPSNACIGGGKTALCVGSGNSLAIAHILATELVERHKIAAEACTPYRAINGSLGPHMAYLLSASAVRREVWDCARVLLNKGSFVTLLTLNGSIEPPTEFNRRRFRVIRPANLSVGDSYLPILNTLGLFMLLFELFDLRSEALSFVNASKSFLSAFGRNRSLYTLDKRSSVFVIIPSYGMRGAAIDLETRIIKSGLSMATIEDPSNLLHGRYMIFAGWKNKKYKEIASAITIARAGEERHLRNIVAKMPKRLSSVNFISTQSGLVGSGEGLMFSVLSFGSLLGAMRGKSPWKLLKWGNELFLLDEPVPQKE